MPIRKTIGPTEPFPLAVPLRHSDIRLCAKERVLWYFMDARPRPCFTHELLADAVGTFEVVASEPNPRFDYLVAASAVPGVFNLGGDLALFAKLARAKDYASLVRYGETCAKGVHLASTGLAGRATTIALVQGDALGGGFEYAISCHVLIAERGTKLGFPEVLFNLFPGMGALSFLSRKLDTAKAKEMVCSGRMYLAETLYEMGLVDVLAEPGAGVDAVNAYIASRRELGRGVNAALIAQQRVLTPPLLELTDIVQQWAFSAMHITERDLRLMERLVAAQNRRLRQRVD